jgi:hypothetical protein
MLIVHHLAFAPELARRAECPRRFGQERIVAPLRRPSPLDHAEQKHGIERQPCRSGDRAEEHAMAERVRTAGPTLQLQPERLRDLIEPGARVGVDRVEPAEAHECLLDELSGAVFALAPRLPAPLGAEQQVQERHRCRCLPAPRGRGGDLGERRGERPQEQLEIGHLCERVRGIVALAARTTTVLPAFAVPAELALPVVADHPCVTADALPCRRGCRPSVDEHGRIGRERHDAIATPSGRRQGERGEQRAPGHTVEQRTRRWAVARQTRTVELLVQHAQIRNVGRVEDADAMERHTRIAEPHDLADHLADLLIGIGHRHDPSRVRRR